MGKETSIEWADSTLNLMMGCDGCELASRGGSGTCYAEILTNRYAGRNGWPVDFYTPKLFTHRLDAALWWPDLMGTVRPEKPWLNGRPRHIFLDDLGDTFTESLPLDWIAPHIPAMAASPHVWMFLTKRPDRMRQFFQDYGTVPRNFMLGTSVIASTARLHDLCAILEAFPSTRLYASVEPLWRGLDLRPFLWRLCLVIVGGESGPKAKAFDLRWARTAISQCREAGTAPFMKQAGSFVVGAPEDWIGHRISGPAPTGNGLEERVRIHLRDKKGGDPAEWPEDLRVREMPQVPEMPHA